jgi:hypothetical protein
MSEVYMGNCFQLFINGRIYAIFPTEQRAKFVLQALSELGLVYESEIRLAYIENTGF